MTSKTAVSCNTNE